MSKIATTEKHTSLLITYVTVVFKSISKRALWKEHGNVPKELFPIPVATRFGTWLNAVDYLVKHWRHLLDFFKTIEDNENAVNAVEMMEKQEVVNRVAQINNLQFLCQYMTASEARDYTIPKAVTAIEEITEKLLDLVNVQPKNLVAEVALDKLSEVVQKNEGLVKAAQMARGEGVLEPQKIVFYSFAPAQNIDVDRLFSILNCFLGDRPNILDENVNKYMFIRYNSSI